MLSGDGVVRTGLSDEETSELRPEGEGAGEANSQRIGIPGRGNSICKGPEVEGVGG